MEPYGPSTYGDRIAEVYDEWYAPRMDPTDAVDLLAELAGEGRALELGIGTGRVALPLAARGVRVSGIDASRAMVERLRAKPGGGEIDVTIGDFADVAVEGVFSLVYVPFTTFFALLSQAEQIRCLCNVAASLEPGGWFVLDAFVPDLTRYNNNQAVFTQEVGSTSVVLDASRHDPVAQRVDSSHVVLTEGGVRIYPVALRYAWPAELDAMAMAAGLDPAQRYGGYDRRPFDRSSTHHVSIFRRPYAGDHPGRAPQGG
jgi:SAM-dependent methyltransferase